ncbi:hypothetical protein B0H13DRAFT_1850401 [Mycena leptocephala]|nr:hypothetical protein B0H13DRAFT_1850401 [Mycena leptocephala]
MASFSSLPPELILKILMLSVPDDLRRLSRVSSLFRRLVPLALNASLAFIFSERAATELADMSLEEPRHQVKDMVIRLKEYDASKFHISLSLLLLPTSVGDFRTQQTVFTLLGAFTNLTDLWLRHGRVTDHIHASVTRLPNLHHIHFENCGIYAFPRNSIDTGNRPFTVTSIMLDNITIFDRDGRPITDYTAAVRDRSLTIFPLPLLHNIHSLSLLCYTSDASLARGLLHDTPRLPQLLVACADGSLPPATLAISNSLLMTFTGPLHVALVAFPSTLHLRDLIITDFNSPEEITKFLRHARAALLHNLTITLTRWDTQLVELISRQFPTCRRLRINYHGSGPSRVSPLL